MGLNNGGLRNLSSINVAANFDVAISATNSPIQRGDTLVVDFSADNTGGASDTQEIRLEIDSVEEDSQAGVFLVSGDTTTGSLEWVTDSNQTAKDYTATVLSENDTATQTVTVASAIPDSAISQEEDGNLSEYTGTTSYFTAEESPTISGSDYSILFSNGTDNSQYVENTFDYDLHEISFYVYPENNNNEVIFVDSSNGNVIFCIYFRDRDNAGIYYSSANRSNGSISNTGSAGSYTNGGELVSGSSVSAKYYHIEILNIDYNNETADIAVDGSVILSNENFILSGKPDILQLSSSFGASENRTGGYVDKIDGS